MNAIIKETNEILHQRSEPVARPFYQEDLQLLDEMFNYIKEHESEAVGLSAVQVGELKRMCAIRVKLGNKTVAYKLLNTRIVKRSGAMEVAEEGCLSLDKDCKVNRHTSVSVMAYDVIQRKDIVINASGFLARVLQHELDHMDGILITDKAVE